MSLEAWGDEGDYGPELPEGWWDEDRAAEAVERIAELERQRDHLHAIVCASLAALSNGSGATPECSIEFLAGTPDEISAALSAIRKQRDELLAALKVERDWEYNGFEPDNQSARWHKLCAIISKAEAANA